MGNLFDDLNKSVRGTTLTNQEIDLFNIIEKGGNTEDIYKYLEDIWKGSKVKSKTPTGKLKKILGQEKKELYNFIMNNIGKIRNNWYNREDMEKIIKEKEMPEEYIDEILNIKKYFTYQTHGILSFFVDKNGETIDSEINDLSNVDKEKTFQKVKALYDYTIGKTEKGDKRFNRLTLDGQGKFGKVAGLISNDKEAKLSDYNLNELKDGYEFARRHGMDIRINTLVFFKDFPDRLIGEDKDKYKVALLNYGKAVATVVNEYKEKGVPTTIDMFNEFVDYFPPFSQRTDNWMSKLSIEDMCDIALELKREMPDSDFGYNDWNFENPQKREEIKKVLKQIKEYEDKNKCKIIDHIGMQCHTNINDIDELKESIDEISKLGLPIDITELDISKGLKGFDYENATPEERCAVKKYERKCQNQMIKLLSEYAEKGIIRGITQWSITDELCCDFCDGKEASITEMKIENGNFIYKGKDIDEEIELTAEDVKLIEENKYRYIQKQNESVNKKPIQDFCFHTHTQRCGHAQKDTGDKDYIDQAIKAGIKKIAFTDHIPFPERKSEDIGARMDISELESYLKEIDFYRNNEKYKDLIEIESGFEFEYDYSLLQHLQYLKSKTNKMILGQHFVIDEQRKKTPN